MTPRGAEAPRSAAARRAAAALLAAAALAGCGGGDDPPPPDRRAAPVPTQDLDQAEEALEALEESDLPADARRELEEAKELLEDAPP